MQIHILHTYTQLNVLNAGQNIIQESNLNREEDEGINNVKQNKHPTLLREESRTNGYQANQYTMIQSHKIISINKPFLITSLDKNSLNSPIT